MKVSCEIIRDLLPLYHDGACSGDSKAFVEAHLNECGSCRAELDAMDGELPLAAGRQNIKETETVQKIAKNWKKGMWKSGLKGALIAALTLAGIALLLFLIVDVKII